MDSNALQYRKLSLKSLLNFAVRNTHFQTLFIFLRRRVFCRIYFRSIVVFFDEIYKLFFLKMLNHLYFFVANLGWK